MGQQLLSMQTAQGRSCSRKAAMVAECGWEKPLHGFGARARARSGYLQKPCKMDLSRHLLFWHKMG